MQLKNYIFRQIVNVPSWLATATGGEMDAAQSFRLSDLTNAGTFTALYDMYRLLEVEVFLQPRITQMVFEPNPTGTAPGGGQLISAIDIDDAVSTNFSGLSQYENAILSGITSGHHRKWKPTAAVGIYNGSSVVGDEVQVSPWINCAADTVPHYSFKAAVTTSADLNQVWDLLCVYAVEFRVVR